MVLYLDLSVACRWTINPLSVSDVVLCWGVIRGRRESLTPSDGGWLPPTSPAPASHAPLLPVPASSSPFELIEMIDVPLGGRVAGMADQHRDCDDARVRSAGTTPRTCDTTRAAVKLALSHVPQWKQSKRISPLTIDPGRVDVRRHPAAD